MSATLPKVLLRPLLICAFCATTSFAQGKEAASTDTAPRLTQQERAEAAMRRSLARQQTALDALRTPTSSSALSRQQASILNQVAGVKPAKPTDSAATETASNAGSVVTSKSFFSLPWPSPIPLAVPNVQLMDQPCESLPQTEVEKLVQTSSSREGIDPNLLRSVMRQESAFKPCAVSVAGAMGLMQIMPGTADMLGLDDPYDPAKNTAAGAKYLKMMLDRYQGDVSMALGAYNAGPGRVDKASGVPPINETMQYVTNILRSLPLN